ncbi:MAG TPA: serpin family protein [Verrucomicrobiae bacterium]
MNAFRNGLIILALSAFAVSAQDKLAEADNGFAFDLLKQIATEQPNQNIFISPFSAATALQMVANGAAGKTLTEMQEVLKTSGIGQADLNADCKTLNDSLASETNVILDLANGIWYQNNFQLKPQFIADNQRYFGAELAAVNFLSPDSAKAINDWADKKTFGKVQDVVSYPFSPATRVILANAIYFKGKWQYPFEKRLTLPHDFHLPDGTVKRVPMMAKRKNFDYQESDEFQAVKMDYAGYRMQMILFLPATNSSPQQLLANFSDETWRDKVLSGFSDREGHLMFPKFKLNYDVKLNDPLKSLGMQQAFSSSADFSAMAGQPLFIGEVKQKAYCAVDEEGTEAAAVTTINMFGAVARAPSKTFEMTVDRPFFYVIADSQSQAILFMGIVNDPMQ